MVSEGADSSRSVVELLTDSLESLDSELALLRDSINNLRLHNGELLFELGILSGEISTLNERLDASSLPSDTNVILTPEPVEAQPVLDEERELQVGDRVRIISRQHFGVEGTVHSFTSQRVRVTIPGRRRPIIRAKNNLVYIPNTQN